MNEEHGEVEVEGGTVRYRILGAGDRTLDCALLHVVRRSEVKDYIKRMRSHGVVECDDGSALDELGIP